MSVLTLAAIADALRASWAADTCSPDDVERSPWHAGNPAWGQCDITALVVNDMFGGDLMCGEVHRDGRQEGYHWWNVLASGVEIDLTREQFVDGQVVTAGERIVRPPTFTWREPDYQTLRRRVSELLGPLPPPAAAPPPA